VKATTKIELGTFQRSLKRKQIELGDGNRKREALSIEDSPDELDRIQHAQQRDFAIGALDRNNKLLREVQAALDRLEAGTFGICLDCEKEISMKRLVAVPWAASCIVCREAADTMTNRPWNGTGELLASAA